MNKKQNIRGIIKQFNYPDWDSQWAGNWPILSFSYWGPFYSEKGFSEYVDQYVKRTIIIWKNGKSFAYQRHSEKAIFAEKITKKIRENESIIDDICSKLKVKTDEFLDFVKKFKGKDIAFKQYKEYQEKLFSYYRYHIPIKVTVDFLPEEILNKALPKFKEARLHSEPVFDESIQFIDLLADIHSKKIGYPSNLVKAMTKNEFEDYMLSGKIPKKEVLLERNNESAFLFLEGNTSIFVSKYLTEIESLIHSEKNEGLIKGVTAYRGKAQGTVRIVSDPTKTKNFKEGDILITGMTRPDYLPLIKKSSAFVTDGGGMLCHAAIVARELKKPCIIGTKIATKIFKDGDFVEVDANKGIVKISKK